MINTKLVKLLNHQINKELESAYLYLDFANYFSEKGLTGFEHWYRVQAKEEIEHAEKFVDYLHDENEKVVLTTLEKVECSMGSDREVLEQGLKHEEYVTELINKIYCEAEKLKDYRMMKFLDWFITEQAEEEKNATELITKYDMVIGDGGMGLYQLDKDLGTRKE